MFPVYMYVGDVNFSPFFYFFKNSGDMKFNRGNWSKVKDALKSHFLFCIFKKMNMRVNYASVVYKFSY